MPHNSPKLRGVEPGFLRCQQLRHVWLSPAMAHAPGWVTVVAKSEIPAQMFSAAPEPPVQRLHGDLCSPVTALALLG